MEFTVTCPIDGAVEVSLEDIDTVVVRESERADITFVCPHCGTEITVSAIIPAFLMAAIEALAEDPDVSVMGGMVVISGEREGEDGMEAVASASPVATEVLAADDPRYDRYCEYFRRQLDSVQSVDDALREMDSRG